MILYVILPFLLFFAVPCIRKTPRGELSPKKRNNIILIFWIITYVVLCGLRNGGGADDPDYRLYYENNYGGSIFSFLGEKEPLFNLIRKLGYLIHTNYKWMFLCYAIITACIIAAALSRFFSDSLLLPLYLASFLFIAYSAMFTTMRQSVAMALLLYIYSFDELPWYKEFLLWVAVLCAHSGFIILLIVDIIVRRLDYKVGKYTRLALPIGCFIFGNILDFAGIINIVTSRLGLFEYMNSDDNFAFDSLGIGVVFLGMLALYIVKELLTYNDKLAAKAAKIRTNKYSLRLSYAQMMYFSLMLLTSRLRWGNRLGYYYLAFLPFIITDLFCIMNFNRRSAKIIYNLSLVALWLGFIFVMHGVLGPVGYQWSIKLWGAV